MSGNWDTYFCQVDGSPASILVDLDLAEGAPHAAFPYMGYISVKVCFPDEHGLPGQEEYERLGELEDALESAITADDQAVYAGRSASSGHFDFFFYLRSGEDWGTRAGEVMATFSEYAWESGRQDDPEWQGYSSFLFPDDYAMNGIQNRRALRELAEQGDDGQKSREIEHWAVFSSPEPAAAFSQAVREGGFSLLPEPPVDSGEEPVFGQLPVGLPEAWVSVRFSRPDTPEDIDAVTYPLVELVQAHGGAYQGWACPVVA
ncbi:MAG: DUF695 domain-containing protein [Desulfovibrionaceae bacterium]|nr:DUF695 domain-containing protein [Desulfovibrionaceae bacterium]